MSGGVTFCQVFPPSRVKCNRPSSDPHQITPGSWGDSTPQKMVQYTSTPVLSLVIGPPEGFCFDLSLRVKSGLMPVQKWPSFVVLNKTLLPAYSVLESCGEKN